MLVRMTRTLAACLAVVNTLDFRLVAPTQYLSIAEFAARVGVSADTLKNYALPPADGLIGRYRGWLPETVDRWNAARPGRGARTDLHRATVRADVDSGSQDQSPVSSRMKSPKPGVVKRNWP